MLSYSNSEQLKEMHQDAQYWISIFDHYQNEVHVFKKIIESRIVGSDISKDDAQITEIENKILVLEDITNIFYTEVLKHELEMRGILECRDISSDMMFLACHKNTENSFRAKSLQFLSEKSEILKFLENIFQK